jgi:ABC-2 type transport system ATP-binding protein
MRDYAIESNGLCRYFGNLTAVDNLALRVPPGSIYGFLGPNGAGKTTTIRMLLGLIRPNAGEIALFGMNLRDNRRACLHAVGALVETPSLYPHLTGRQNLEVTRRLIGAPTSRIDRGLAMVGLTDAADRRTKFYSTGMKQRLSLALALLQEPRLLILDEPTNGLDPAGIREIRALILELAREHNITVFLSSHLLAEVQQVATHIGILQQGKLRFQGTLDELQAQMDNQVVLSVDQPELAQHLLNAAGWHAQWNGNGHIWTSVNGVSDAAMINAQLVRNGINVYHLNLEQPTLEDIFLNLTEAG